ncbi:hypothetical protein [Leifsonia sp. EB34]|uniref:hypothetical protein n=1 Tax=Leifsonia sp. EB34 TaxID=3156303 RepID=UPI003515B6FA
MTDNTPGWLGRLVENRFVRGVLADIETARQREAAFVASPPQREATGMGGMYLAAVGGALLLVCAVAGTLALHVVAPIPAAGPWLGANVLAWLTQSFAVLFLSAATCTVLHVAFKLNMYESNPHERGSVRRLGRAALASIRRIANKFGFVAICLLVGYISVVAVFPNAAWGPSGGGYSVPEEIAKVQLGLGLFALVFIVAYECVRVLEDLLGSLPATFRTLGTLGFLCFTAHYVTEGIPLLSFEALYLNVLNYWAPATGYAPYTREQALAELSMHGLGSVGWLAVMLMLALFGFRRFWVHLTRPRG